MHFCILSVEVESENGATVQSSPYLAICQPRCRQMARWAELGTVIEILKSVLKFSDKYSAQNRF